MHASCLEEGFPTGSLGAHSHFSLNARTSRQSPPNQWGWTHSKLPPMSLLPSRILCEEQRCAEQGVFIQGTSDPGTQLFRLRPSLLTHVHTHKAGVPPPHQRDPWQPLRTAPKKNVLGMSDGETGRGRLLTGLEEVGDEDLGRGPEQPLDQTRMPRLSPFRFPTPRSYRETKEPAAAPTPLPSRPCGKQRMNKRG